MCKASQGLAEAIGTGAIEHPDDAALTKHLTSAAARFYGVGWRFVKAKGSRAPIDAVIALAMAVRVLQSTVTQATETSFRMSTTPTVTFGGFR